jgi:hypothetical protein
VGSVTTASGATRRSPDLLKEKIMEEVEQSRRLTDRRSFLLKGAAVGAGAIGASRLLVLGDQQLRRQRPGHDVA